MRVRIIKSGDYKGLMDLLDESYEEVKENPDLGEVLRLQRPSKISKAKWFSEICKMALNGDCIYFVAEENGEIVGSCSIMKKDIPDSEASHVGVLGIRVSTKWRNRGIGSKLIKEALKRSKGKFEIIELSVFSKNRAKRLYKRVGFKTWGLAPWYVKRGKRYMDMEYMYLKL